MGNLVARQEKILPVHRQQCPLFYACRNASFFLLYILRGVTDAAICAGKKKKKRSAAATRMVTLVRAPPKVRSGGGMIVVFQKKISARCKQNALAMHAPQ
jgi:hypothetical protein